MEFQRYVCIRQLDDDPEITFYPLSNFAFIDIALIIVIIWSDGYFITRLLEAWLFILLFIIYNEKNMCFWCPFLPVLDHFLAVFGSKMAFFGPLRYTLKNAKGIIREHRYFIKK
jgi:hypothetical protein